MSEYTLETADFDKVAVLQFLASKRAEAKSAGNLKAVRYYDVLVETAARGGLLVTCTDFVESFNDTHQVSVLPNGVYQSGDLVRNHKAFFYRLHSAWKEYRNANGLKENFSREEVALEFEAILEDRWDDKRRELRAHLAPIDDPAEFDVQLRAFCHAVFGLRYPDEDSVEFRRQMAFIGHFLWQAQTKLHHGAEAVLRQGNESMLMLVSQQQKTGKSTTIKRLIKPYLDAGFVWRTDFTRLEDQFSMQNLAYNYVAFFDDMSRGSVKNMGKFKQIVTDDEVHFRGMYTQTEHRMPKLSTLIGSSNKCARELMHDTTGLRRFHQVFVNNGSVDHGQGIDLDFLAQYDHRNLIRLTPMGPTASPLYNYLTEAELAAYEEHIRPKHVVELWLEEQDFTLTDDVDNGIVKSKDDMYSKFVTWAGKNGYSGKYTPNAESFSNKLIELGGVRGRTSKYRGFYVQEEQH